MEIMHAPAHTELRLSFQLETQLETVDTIPKSGIVEIFN